MTCRAMTAASSFSVFINRTIACEPQDGKTYSTVMPIAASGGLGSDFGASGSRFGVAAPHSLSGA
ncbi:hypothetical protein PT2222_480018 [Paraburkholderia tropica]